MESYLETTIDVYHKAALSPNEGLCCTTNPIWQLPGLTIPGKMLKMNYGCGSTVHPADLSGDPAVLYVGIGGGMELLQFTYFSRHTGKVVGLDVVDQMIDVCDANLKEAEKLNPWFRRDFIRLIHGNALALAVEDSSIDIAAQNCLFNIFTRKDLVKAIGEMYRVLKPGGRLILSDPVCDTEMPQHLADDEDLRAICLSGAISLNEYLHLITSAGFGTVEVRAKYPYRILSKEKYALEADIFIESVEICAIKDLIPADGPCIFTGRSAIYFGSEEYFDDHNGHILLNNHPLSICNKTAEKLAALNRSDIFISDSTWHYNGGGCC